MFFFLRNKYIDTREMERGFNTKLHHKLHLKAMVIQCKYENGQALQNNPTPYSLWKAKLLILCLHSVYSSLHYWVLTHVENWSCVHITRLQIDLVLTSMFLCLTCIQCSNALNVTLTRHVFKIGLIFTSSTRNMFKISHSY